MAEDERETYETVSMQLAAAAMAEIPQVQLEGISADPTVDGKRVIKLAYPAAVCEQFGRLVADFGRKVLRPNLFNYNRQLNRVRDEMDRAQKLGRRADAGNG